MIGLISPPIAGTKTVFQSVKSFIANACGATAIECVLIASLMAIAILGLSRLGPGLRNTVREVSRNLQ
jgi:Flp pilus assembly pilin Flp